MKPTNVELRKKIEELMDDPDWECSWGITTDYIEGQLKGRQEAFDEVLKRIKENLSPIFSESQMKEIEWEIKELGEMKTQKICKKCGAKILRSEWEKLIIIVSDHAWNKIKYCPGGCRKQKC